MNKIYLIIAYFVFYLYTGISLANPQQGNWRWRNDDGDVYTATWKDSLNIPVILTGYENIRLRIQSTYHDQKSANISLRYTDDVYTNLWIPITSVDTGKFFISPSLFLSDTAIYLDNLLLSITGSLLDSLPVYCKTITFDYTDNYILNGLSTSAYELEFSIKPTTKLQKSSAYFFSLFVDKDPIFREDKEYPVLMTSPVNWATQYSGTIASLYDVSFFDENNGIAVGGQYG